MAEDRCREAGGGPDPGRPPAARRRCRGGWLSSVAVADRPERPAPTNQDLIRWSEALAGIARTGLGFTESQYERERFEEVLAVAADIRHAAGSPYEEADLVEGWMKMVGSG